jgi:hypothetical protein
MGRLRRAGIGLLALSLVTTGGAACGDDDDGDDEGATTSSTEAEAEAIEVTAVDYGYEDLPESVSAGTQLTLTNSSDKELHELVAFLLPEDEDRSIDDIAKLPEAELGRLFAGEPAMVLIAPPSGGEMIPAVGDGTLNDTGRYAVFCAIPVGADPQEYLEAAQASEGGPPQVEGGPPHFTQGMYGEITVE